MVAVLAAVLLVARLVDLQVMSAPSLAERGRKQLIRTDRLPAERGAVFDRNGRELAMSVQAATIAADPRLVTDPDAQAGALAAVLPVDRSVMRDRLARPGAKFVYLARRVSDEQALRVAGLALPGVFRIFEPARVLPADELATSVLGKVGVDNEGLSGVEHQFEGVLKGKPGRLVAERDQQGREIPGGRIEYDPSARGDDIVLTIDRSLQFEAERRLAAQIISTSAKGGMAVVMDTKTGELLAMANLVVDPESGAVRQADTNTAITNVYEPGSVAKLVTVAGAIEEGVVAPDAVMQVPGSIRVGDHTFTEHDPHPTEAWSVTDIVANSSNVGTIMIAKKLGKQRFDKALRDFGFGTKTGLDAPGESAGILMDPSDYTGTSMGSFPIGQGIATTPVQVLAAYNAVANGGAYVAPKLVKATVGPDGAQHPSKPSDTRRVVSAQTAAEMTRMLTEVVRVGTGNLAAVDGYAVAGKTGTARKPNVGKRGYEEGAYVSSFAGFVPAEDPRLSALVVLDQPTPIFGGLVAAPVFADLARYALRELRIPPPTVPLPSTRAKAATEAAAKGVGDAGDVGAPTTALNSATSAVPPAPAVDPSATSTTTTPASKVTARPGPTTTRPSSTSTTARRSTTTSTTGPPASRRPSGTVSGR